MTFKHLALFTTASILALGLTACGDNTATTDNGEMQINTDIPDYESHLYLEEVEGAQALAKVGEWNDASAAKMKGDLYNEISAELLEVYNSPEKIPYASFRRNRMNNFWQDETNVRGVWRQTTQNNYLRDNPTWTTILDVDALADAEGKNWVYKGNNCLAPAYLLCLVSLSEGGKDATEIREFDMRTKDFVEDGFVLPESKGSAAWLGANNLLIGRDFGEGTLTESGYPMIAKMWRRGQPMGEARTLMTGELEDVGVWPGTFENAQGRDEILITRATTFYDTEYYWIPRTGDDRYKPVRLPVPTKVELSGQHGDQMLVRLQEDWKGYGSGALVSFSVKDFMDDASIDTVYEVISPTARQSIGNFGVTKSGLLLSLYDNVAGSAHMFTFDSGKWSGKKLDFPENGNISIGSTNSKEDIAFISSESFLQPDTLWMIDTSDGEITEAKKLPSWFDSGSMVAEQFFATSKDGTQVPYFVVRGKDIAMDGSNPTLLYGYGGFEISLNPSYSATRGKLWLENGGVYVLANIRGGGEYGPNWHQAGLKTDRQRIYDDFISVAEDLIAKKITSPAHLGVEGGSNGGLLTGVMTTQRPDLFNAAIIAVPLLDMQRFHKLLAGASWMGEYGDPDDAVEGKFLRSISPYHNLDPDGDYPEVFLITSTKDDRVHPGHARKFAKRMEDQGHEFFYYENIDGGHSAAANLKETANRLALQHVYLMKKLKDGK